MRKLKLPGRDESKPRLSEEDIKLVREIGIQGVKEQARKIVEKKLSNRPDNDGSQTPRAGNPVYKAMHACNVASRAELSRAHRIPAGRDLSEKQEDAVVNLLVRWVTREYNFYFMEQEEKQRDLGEFA